MNLNRLLLFALCAVIVSGCAPTHHGSPARNKELLRRAHAEVWSRENMAAADQLYAPDFLGHSANAVRWKVRTALLV